MLYNINTDLFYFINHGLENSFLNYWMPKITGLGGFVFLVLILVMVILIARLKNKPEIKNLAIICLAALLFADIIALAIKYAVNEPRPFAALSDVHLLITEDDPRSFPSGHATSTFAVITCLILNAKEYVKKNYLLIQCGLIIFGLIIIFSRIYVGVHYPLDVIAGAVLGIAGGFVINKFKNEILGIYYKIIRF